MKYLTHRYAKEIVKQVLLKVSSLFCTPLSQENTRSLPFLEPVSKTDGFEWSFLTINGVKTELPVKVVYPDSILFKATNSEAYNLRLLPSGGICNERKILCSSFGEQQAYNILGYLKSLLKKKQTISGTIICNWSQQFLTYGDFVLQLLPEMCLIKSLIAPDEWLNAYFILPRPPKFMTEYLKLLGCSEHQIIDSSKYCFDLAPKSQIYFREKDPMWFLCAPLELLQISREYLLTEQSMNHRGKEILFIERLGGYRNAIGLTEDMKSSLREIGVSFFNPSGVPIKTQIEIFANARIVIGVHGAGIANIVWCQQGTKVIEIFHPKFAPWCYAILAHQLGIDYYSLGENPGSMDTHFRESDVNVDWNRLIELVKSLKSDTTQFMVEPFPTNI